MNIVKTADLDVSSIQLFLLSFLIYLLDMALLNPIKTPIRP